MDTRPQPARHSDASRVRYPVGPVGYKGLWEDDFEVKLERDRQNTLSAATEILQSAGLRSSMERKAEEGHSQSAIDHRDLHVVENPRYAGAGMIPNSELRKKAVAAALRRWGDANPEAPLSKLSPDPIIIDHKSIGLTPDFCSTVLWTNNGEEIVYSNGCTIIALRVKVAAVCWLALPHCCICPPTVFFLFCFRCQDHEDTHPPGHQRHFSGHTSPVSSLALSGNNRILASGQHGELPCIRLWGFQSGVCVATLSAHHNTVACLSFSLDDTLLAGVGNDQKARSKIVRSFGLLTIPMITPSPSLDFRLCGASVHLPSAVPVVAEGWKAALPAMYWRQ